MISVSFDAVDQMIKAWMTEVADHPAIYNQGNVLRDKLATLPKIASAATAAKWVEERHKDYVAENGIYDPETNATEFPDGGEYAGELEEIIEGLRDLSGWESDTRLITSAPRLFEALRKASQLASVASDWNLYEVEIDGQMVPIYDLKDQFDAALALYTSEKEVG